MLLMGLWWSSLLLTLVVLGWMAGLIAARVLKTRWAELRAERRRRLMDTLLALMRGEGEAAARLVHHLPDAPLLAEATLDITGLVRGGERDRLVASLAGL